MNTLKSGAFRGARAALAILLTVWISPAVAQDTNLKSLQYFEIVTSVVDEYEWRSENGFRAEVTYQRAIESAVQKAGMAKKWVLMGRDRLDLLAQTDSPPLFLRMKSEPNLTDGFLDDLITLRQLLQKKSFYLIRAPVQVDGYNETLIPVRFFHYSRTLTVSDLVDCNGLMNGPRVGYRDFGF